MQDNVFQKVYQYIMEIIFLYIVLVLFYFHTPILPPILPFLMIVGLGGLAYLYLLSKLKERTPYFVVMILIPLVAYISSLFGLGFGLSITLSAFICWRIIAYYNQGMILSESTILIITLCGGFLIYLGSVVQVYPHKNITLYLMITQLLFLMLGKILNGLFISKINDKNTEAKKQSSSMLILFSGLFGAAIVVAVGFPLFFNGLLSLIMSIVGKGLYTLSIPLFNAVDNADFERNPQGAGADGRGWDNSLEDNKSIYDFLDGLSWLNLWTVLSILGIMIIAILAFILGRKKMVKNHEAAMAGNPYTVTVESSKKAERTWFKKNNAPAEKVRKLLYDLEIHAARKGRGRYGHETAQEWLAREKFLDSKLVLAYEKVRYGEELLSEQENKQCDEIVKQLKSKMRDLKQQN